MVIGKIGAVLKRVFSVQIVRENGAQPVIPDGIGVVVSLCLHLLVGGAEGVPRACQGEIGTQRRREMVVQVDRAAIGRVVIGVQVRKLEIILAVVCEHGELAFPEIVIPGGGEVIESRMAGPDHRVVDLAEYPVGIEVTSAQQERTGIFFQGPLHRKAYRHWTQASTGTEALAVSLPGGDVEHRAELAAKPGGNVSFIDGEILDDVGVKCREEAEKMGRVVNRDAVDVEGVLVVVPSPDVQPGRPFAHRHDAGKQLGHLEDVALTHHHRDLLDRLCRDLLQPWILVADIHLAVAEHHDLLHLDGRFLHLDGEIPVGDHLDGILPRLQPHEGKNRCIDAGFHNKRQLAVLVCGRAGLDLFEEHCGADHRFAGLLFRDLTGNGNPVATDRRPLFADADGLQGLGPSAGQVALLALRQGRGALRGGVTRGILTLVNRQGLRQCLSGHHHQVAVPYGNLQRGALQRKFYRVQDRDLLFIHGDLHTAHPGWLAEDPGPRFPEHLVAENLERRPLPVAGNDFAGILFLLEISNEQQMKDQHQFHKAIWRY